LILALYIILILNISDLLPANLFVETIFYIAVGVAWIPLVVRLMGWAQRDNS
jgi:hypothetical protein